MTSRIWAVTCLFNPQRYTRRAMNYRRFRENLTIPLLSVELSFDGSFELAGADADILVRLTEGDVLWQKERLLNIGVSRLPAECEAVAVLDSDIVFERNDWPQRAVDALKTAQAVQPFQTALYLTRDADALDARYVEVDGSQPSIARLVEQGYSARHCLGTTYRDGSGPTTVSGLAWVYSRQLLAAHGLFDGSIAGGGDTATAAAGWGAFEAVNERHVLNADQKRYYRAWAEPWHRDVDSRVACLDGDLFHLWHGDLTRRRPSGRSRHHQLADLGFDPYNDVAASPGAAWHWARDRPELRRFVSGYFENRRDDG